VGADIVIEVRVIVAVVLGIPVNPEAGVKRFEDITEGSYGVLSRALALKANRRGK